MRLHAVLAASTFALALLVARALLTGRADFLFLAWNLFLALVPVALAWPPPSSETAGPSNGPTWLRRAVSASRGLAWWLFFPNSAYLVTDLVHLRPRAMPYWFDVGLFAAFAIAGLAASAHSLERMRAHVPSRYRVAFVLAVAASAGFAIWVGRFLRFNSWDALLAPWRTLMAIGAHAADRPAQAVGVTILFGGLLLVAHAAALHDGGDRVGGRI